ncbi:DUF4249 domain-containing protein [Spirosoma linguale]|uniref:DUF4249 domain-containing protein n=1 Tax=Spirosoma linguale (strain ATCC 33905 / DSM 74 / LMG 10896 / Claus 1) TaxID=504472 RepID=D2QSB5_SPILD|nr:hypothetical protein Slin_5732 [Spirosoma linguale DSM 74]
MRTNRLTLTDFSTLITFLSVIGLFIGCSSLRNEVDPSLLGFASSKLVVTGYLSPQDTTLAVKVTRSKTVVGNDSLDTGSNVTDATVTLTEGSRSVILRYNRLNSPVDSLKQPYYSASARMLPIITGRTYTLTVTTPNGERVRSTCTVPNRVRPTAVTFDSTTENQGRSLLRRYYVLVRWQDPPGEANYYQVTGYFQYMTKPVQGVSLLGTTQLSNSDDNRGLFSDAGLDGTQMISGKAYMLSTPFTSDQVTNFYGKYRDAKVTVNLMSVDRAYYQFQEAVIRQRRVRNNPFAEPVLIPSNIEGGLGCFAGYNNATLTLKLK